MGKLPMNLLNPIPEVVEQENSMKEALTKPDSKTFAKKKSDSPIPPTPLGSSASAEIPKADSDASGGKKKKPRGVSAMSPTSRAAHMKKMREASARSRKAKAEAKKNAKTNESAPTPLGSSASAAPTPRQPTPPPTPMGSSASAVAAAPAPLPATAPIPIPTPVANPIQHRDWSQAQAQYAPIDYERLAEVMEKRSKPKTREVTAEQLNYFERTIRSQERDKTLADIEKEQEKKIQEFMNKRTKRRGMPKVGEATTRYSDAWGGRK